MGLGEVIFKKYTWFWNSLLVCDVHALEITTNELHGGVSHVESESSQCDARYGVGDFKERA